MLNSVTRNGCFHVDEYGFRHCFEEIPLAVHFIATQLHQHYQTQSKEHAQLKAKWRALLEAEPNRIVRSVTVGWDWEGKRYLAKNPLNYNSAKSVCFAARESHGPSDRAFGAF